LFRVVLPILFSMGFASDFQGAPKDLGRKETAAAQCRTPSCNPQEAKDILTGPAPYLVAARVHAILKGEAAENEAKKDREQNR